MCKARFSVTYELVSDESAQHGDAFERGYAAEGVCLRDALAELHATRSARVDSPLGVALDSHPCTRPRAVYVHNGMEWDTGVFETRALHIPDNVTASSARRIARLAGASI